MSRHFGHFSLNLVEVECTSSTNAFQVFDSLNGKGLDLTAADRIKNLFLSWCPEGKKGIQKWNSIAGIIGEDNLVRFFTCLAFVRSERRVSKRQLPDKFKSSYKETACADFDYFESQLRRNAADFAKLNEKKTGNKALDNGLLVDLESINQDQVMVMLLAAPYHYGSEILQADDFVNYTRALLNLIVRMQVCEKHSNRLDGIFSDALRKMTGKPSLKVITADLKLKLDSFVDDDQFELAFCHLSLKDMKVACYYLTKLEEWMRREKKNRNPVDRASVTVEHVIPQTLDDLASWYGKDFQPTPEFEEQFYDSYVQSIGNMALIYQDDNSAAGNHPYSEKLKIYQAGCKDQKKGTPAETFRTIGQLIERYPNKFTHEEVLDRAAYFATLAKDIWK